MISNPKYGWCIFDFEGFEGTCSYLTDVPIDLLEFAMKVYKGEVETTCSFDEEGTNFALVSTSFGIFIISERHTLEIQEVHMSREDILKEVVADVKMDYEGWKSFLIDNEAEDETNTIKCFEETFKRACRMLEQ